MISKARALQGRRVSARVALLASFVGAFAWPWGLLAQTVPSGRENSQTSATKGATVQVRPTALQHADRLIEPAQVPVVAAAPVDRQAVALEDEQRELAGLAPRFAIPNDVFRTPVTDGVWEASGSDTLVWRLRVSSPGAHSLNLGFTRYHMPEGGRLLIYASDFSRVVRPFTSRDNAAHGELWTPVVLSDDIMVEVTLPASARNELELELTSINVGYRGFGDAAFVPRSGSCNVDVVCSQGDPWRDEIPSVAVISTGGALFCSGAMINNTAQDQTPYFLTANHCGINSGNAASLVVYWNYETSTCGGTPDGSLNDFQSGSFFRAGYSSSDFTLVELDQSPDPAWGVTFAGWDRSGADASSAVAIHHPNTDEKRISFEYDPTTTTSYLQNSVPGDGTHVRVADWDLGTTEGGSSGSPLFDQNHHIVGQLHGGYAACGNNSSDWYGRFSVSWNGGGSASSRLRDWLDPGNTGATNVNTLVPNPPEPMGGCCVGTSCSVETQANCQAMSGSYLGDGTDCQGTTGNTTVYQATPNAAIPDGGGPGNPVTHTINVPDSVTIGDVDIDLGITHTWVGDLIVTVAHGGTTVTVIDRPGYTGSGFGCSANNYNNIILDDEGTGGAIESQCTGNLSSPPNYTPNQALSAFDGMDSVGDWVITVSDSASQDSGTLDTWSVHIAEQGAGPCVSGCGSDAECDDGLYCNGAETCVGGSCQAGTAINCDDGVNCTDDSCNEGTDSCDNVANDANCDDGQYCNGAETCDAQNDCQAGTAVNCDDGVGCTDDSCNEGTDSCDNTANDANCDDGQYCNGAETCDAQNDCQTGTAVNCDDGVGCTDDSCNEATDSCDSIANDGNCDNGLFCDGAETCDAQNDCQPGGDPCPGELCDEINDVCVGCQNDVDCDDGVYCNGAETCVGGSCQTGTAVNCDDGVACTDDSCNEGTDSCDNVANDANCDNGLFCDGVETCDAQNDCQAGAAVNCDDGVACTDDSCNEGTDSCDNVANDGNCDNGLFCDGAETCDAVLDCQAGTAVNCDDGVGCTDDSCNEASDTCDNIANNANCPDDGLFCNGAESCDAAADCVSSGDPCGAGESCNEATDTCDPALTGEGYILSRNADFSTDDRAFNRGETIYMKMWSDVVDFNDINRARWELKDPAKNKVRQPFTNHFDGTYTASFALSGLPSTAVDWTWKGEVKDNAGNRYKPTDAITVTDAPQCTVDADCDDGAYCNGAEICDAAGTCQSGAAVNCDDGIGCTDDSCNETTDSCDNVANDANCDDGQYCNGTETCDAVLDCQSGTSVNCDDGIGCTDDSCNDATASCDNTPNDANCDDGLFCNGAETCDAVLDCQAGGDPCGGGPCDETNDLCVECFGDGDCDDGLFCNGAETCVGGLCQAGGDPCPGQTCDEATDTCVDCLGDADCDDGLYCNGAETCVGGTCQGGTAVDCDDGVACTDDSCNEAADSCDNITNDANCGDGLFCNGAETCDAVLDCQAGAPVSCDDGVGCTDDSCNEATDTCDNIANNANCPDDGLFCNGTESCDVSADCVSSGDPCGAGESCNEATDTCDPAQTGEGYILSRNADFSTDDRVFNRNETIYMKMWSDVVDFNDINRARWELKDAAKNKVRQPFTNHFDGTYTASFALSGLPSSATAWTWKGEVKDNAGNRYKPTDAITVLP